MNNILLLCMETRSTFEKYLEDGLPILFFFVFAIIIPLCFLYMFLKHLVTAMFEKNNTIKKRKIIASLKNLAATILLPILTFLAVELFNSLFDKWC